MAAPQADLGLRVRRHVVPRYAMHHHLLLLLQTNNLQVIPQQRPFNLGKCLSLSVVAGCWLSKVQALLCIFRRLTSIGCTVFICQPLILTRNLKRMGVRTYSFDIVQVYGAAQTVGPVKLHYK